MVCDYSKRLALFSHFAKIFEGEGVARIEQIVDLQDMIIGTVV